MRIALLWLWVGFPEAHAERGLAPIPMPLEGWLSLGTTSTSVLRLRAVLEGYGAVVLPNGAPRRGRGLEGDCKGGIAGLTDLKRET